MGQLIPFYIYPDISNATGAWNTVIAKHELSPSVPMVVIADCDNGPGTAIDQNYVAGIKSLQAAGIKVVGYTDTAYGQYFETQVNAQNLQWKEWYGVDGIFFDDMVSTTGEETYYTTLAQYVKSPAPGGLGLSLTIGNPGTSPPLSYAGVMDVLLVCEGPTFPTVAQMQAWSTLSQKVAVIINGATTVSTSQLSQVQANTAFYYLTQMPGWQPSAPVNTYGTLSQWL